MTIKIQLEWMDQLMIKKDNGSRNMNNFKQNMKNYKKTNIIHLIQNKDVNLDIKFIERYQIFKEQVVPKVLLMKISILMILFI